jgi:hypothetical protein
MIAKTITLASLLAAAPAIAQHEGHGQQSPEYAPQASDQPMDHAHAGHGMAAMHEEQHGPARESGATFLTASGTARLPAGGHGMSGLHIMADQWMLMAHGFATLNYTDHKGPRGDDLLYSTSMLMVTGERDLGGARLQLRSMVSLEPTMSARGYPNLFATGETAGGEPLVDRQHPHDLFMELAARFDVDVAPGTRLFVYGGPVGEPAIGPAAFMMRGSARVNPEPPIGHHWFDATHITYGVVTAGIETPHWQLEGSAFRGQEPDEQRWDIETPRLDSWSARLNWTPTPNWSAQVSHAFLKQPEVLHGEQNEHRTTATVHYADKRLSAMIGFAAKNRDPGATLTAWLGEITYDLSPRHTLFSRIENVANDELVPDHDDPLHDRPFRVTKMQAGYAWTTPLGKSPVSLTLGGSANLYAKPAALDALYGDNPWGYSLFARLSLGR